MNNIKSMSASILFCFVFILSFYFLFDFDFFNRGDFQFHYDKSAGNETYAEIYAFGAHILGSFFAYNKQNFVLFVLLLVFLVTPILLWHIHKSFLTVLFYFATQYPFFMLMTISQALAGVFLVGLFLTKNNYLRFLMLVGGAVAHSKGGILILFVWFIILFFENFDSKKLFLACTPISKPVLGKITPISFDNRLPVALNQSISLTTIFNFFISIMPLPFLYFGLRQLWKERNFAPILVSLIAFGSIFLQMDRTLYVIPLMIIPYSAKFLEAKKFKYKLTLYLFPFVLIFFQISGWVNVVKICN